MAYVERTVLPAAEPPPSEKELAQSPVIRMAGSDGRTYRATADRAHELAQAASEAGVALEPFIKTADRDGNVHEISPFDGAALKEAQDRGDTQHFEGAAEVDYFSPSALKAGAARFAIGLVNPWDWMRGIGTAATTVLRGYAKGTVGMVLKGVSAIETGAEYVEDLLHERKLEKERQRLGYTPEQWADVVRRNPEMYGPRPREEGVAHEVERKFNEIVDKLTPDFFEKTGEYDGNEEAKGVTEATRGVVEMVANLRGIGSLTKSIEAERLAAGASKAMAATQAHAATGALFGLGKYDDVANDPNGPGGARQQAAALAAGTADAVIFGIWNPFKIGAKAQAELRPFMEATKKEVAKRVVLKLAQAFNSGASMATVEAVRQGAEQVAGAGTESEWGEREMVQSAKEVGAQFLVGSAFVALDVAEQNMGRFGYARDRREQGDIPEGYSDKMKVAMSYQVERNRRDVCPKYHEQAVYAYNRFVKQGGRGESFREGLSQAPDVRRVNEDGSVVFDDGSVWRPDPRMKDGNVVTGATITVSDGTILSESGELLGYRPRQENGAEVAPAGDAQPRTENAQPRAGDAQGRAENAQPRVEGEKPESNALLLLQQLDEGKLPVEDVAVGDVETLAPTENGNVIGEYDPAKAKPIVVWEDMEGNRHAVTGGKRLSMATASGAETVKAVVVREADGWSETDARGLGATENLREGHGTIKNVVDAVDSLGADRVAELAGWHQANGSREFASTIRKGLAVAQKAGPELKTALADGAIGEDFAYNAAQVLSMERAGEGWETAQRELAGLVGKVGPEELEAVLWGLKQRLDAGEVKDFAAAIAEERAKYNEKKGGKPGQLDSDAVLMETEDGELKTLGELEAEQGDNLQPTTDNLDVGGRPSDIAPNLTAAEGAGQNKAVQLQPVAGKPGTFATLSHPKARFTVDGEKKVVAVDGLMAEDFAPGRGESAAALVARIEAYAAENGLKIGFYDDAVEAAWNSAKERIKAEAAERVAGEQLKETTKVVISELQKSFPGSEVVRSIEEFNAKTGRKLTTAVGQVYGIVDPETGHVYLNPEIFGTRVGLETPIHEFGHLGIIECEKVNKPVYDRGMKLAMELLEGKDLTQSSQSPQSGDGETSRTSRTSRETNGGIRELVDFVNATYADHSAKGKAEELMAQLIGKRGAAALKAETNATVVQKVKSWLVEFWNTFGKALGLKDITPEQAEKMTLEDVADAIRAEMFSGRKYGEGLDRVEFAAGGAQVRTRPVRLRKKLTGRRKAVNEFVNRMGGEEDPANTETDLLALWVDNGGRLFDRMPFEVETTYSKGASGVKTTRRTVADEFAESTAFYRDLDPAQRKVFFGSDKLETGSVGEGLKNKLQEAGITRFTREDGTVDYDAAIDEFKRQWTNYERGEEFLKERNEWQEERDRAYVEEMERAEREAYDELSAQEAQARAEMESADEAERAQIAADIEAGLFSRHGPLFARKDRQILFSRKGKDGKEEKVDVGERPYIKANQSPNRSYGSDPGLPGAIEQENPGTAACRAIDSLDKIPNLPPRVKRATANFKAMADAVVSGKVPKGWANPVSAENFLGTLTGFGFVKESPTSALLVLPDVSIRVSDHSGNADRFVKDSNWSIVLETRRFLKPLNKDPKKNVVEFKLSRSYLKDHPERMASLLQSMAEFAVNGEIHDTIGVRGYKFSGSDEYVTAAIERLKADARERGDEMAIAKLNAELPSFKKNFFGDWEKNPEKSSKTVDKHGAPQVVWHGDQDPSFTVFDKGKIQRGVGFWFAVEESEAASYAKDAEPRAFYLNIRNPAREADLKGKLLDEYHANGGAGASWKAFVWDRHAADFLRSRGYDGIEFEGKWIAFEPTQIKSATDNNGNFSKHPDILFSRSGIFTGTAADYANRSRQGGTDDGPSLKKIGTGEGTQVYGWGLYGSTVRGVAEGYAKDAREYNAEKNGKRIDLIFPENMLEAETAKRLMENGGDVRKTIEKLKLKGIGSAIIKELEEHGAEYSVAPKHEQLYEQTFFTDRAPGDESHLLKWYEPVSEENIKRVLDQYAKEHDGADLRADTPSGTITLEDFGDRKMFADALKENADALKEDGASLYRYVSGVLGSERAASEFLSRAGIDGVKYPVDSYGGKGVKNGDEVGWNYVSFRDDNIRVDHKWRDGQLLFARAPSQSGQEYIYSALTAKPDMSLVQVDAERAKQYGDHVSWKLADARKSILAAGGRLEKGHYIIDMEGEPVEVGKKGLLHGKHNRSNDFVYPILGEVLKNAVRVNELGVRAEFREEGKKDDQVKSKFVYLGAAAYGDEVLPVRIQIDRKAGKNEIGEIDVLKSFNAKWRESHRRPEPTRGVLTSASAPLTTVSIANLIKVAQPLHPEIFSRDVAANLNVPYRGGNLNALYSRAPEAEHVKLTRIADDAGQGELTNGAIAASAELMRQAPTPLTQKGTRYVSLPLSELHALSRYLTGHAMPAEMESGKKLGKAGKASLKHRKLTIAADVLGVVDKTDAAAETATLKQHGFFRHEDANWCATHSPTEVRKERERSEDALSSRLEALADRRISGREPGGNAAGRKVFADQLAKIVMSMPHGQPGVLGAMQTVAGALQKRVKGNDAEADAFIDWMKGGTPVGGMDAQTRKLEMFSAFLIMPKEMEARAKGWYDAIRSTIAADQKLADTFRKMTARSMSEQGYKHLESEILRMQDAQTEAAIKKLQAEANEPIKAGGKLDQAKETVVLACDDRMGAAVVRVDAAAKVYLAAQKKLMAAAKTPAEKAQIKQQTDLFMGQLAQAKNQAELSRTAWERGRDNADARYLWRMVDLLNEATVRDGLKAQDLSLYLDQMRVIETRGLSGSRGESARQAQLILDAMRRRLGGDFAKVEAFARKFHAIHEQELLNNPLLEKILGKGTADYWKSQTSYVTTKRTFSPEELAEIEAARRVLAASGVAGGDTVVGQMFKYCGRPEATAKLKGSFADKQEVMSATFEKVAEVQRFLRRSEYVIRLRDMLKLANVEGVHDLPAGKNEFKSNARYGSIGYMENGHRRVLVVPKEIARGFERQATYDTGALKICAAVNNVARQLWIDWNPVYWHRNLSRNAGSIEMNMPGMRESIVKRGARFVFPGLAPVTEMAMTHLVRHMPERMSLPLRKLWGEHTALFYAPKAKRMAMWITDHSEMQRRLWDAQKRGDLGAVQEMMEDQRDMLAAMRANMLVGLGAGKASGTAGFLDESVRTVGKTMQREMQELAAMPKWRRALNAVNIFEKNAKQQVFEDIMAKFSAYLHDRAQFGNGNNRTAEESGLVVKKNVSIGEGERKGESAGMVQAIFQPFWNMVEKGVVRNVKAYGERPGETFQKAAWRIAPMLLQGLVGSGAIAAWILKANDGDEEKAKNGPMGDVYRYARDAQRAYQNCSNYVRNNYHVTPLFTDGYTSVVIGMPLTDEERLLKPIARFVTDAAAVAAGTKESMDVAGFLSDATGVITPDFKIAGALPTILDDTVHALMENPTDYYTGGQKYDRDLYAVRNESWEMRGKFAAAMGKRLWNDFGGRNVLPVDRAGVDNGLGKAPGWVAAMVNDIPVASPILRSFVKVQVGSPRRDAAEITEAEQKRRAVCGVLAKELFELAHKAKRDVSMDAEKYVGLLQKWEKTYGLTPEELASIEAKYLNAWRAYEGAQYKADGEREKFRAKAEKLGLDAANLWLDFD